MHTTSTGQSSIHRPLSSPLVTLLSLVLGWWYVQWVCPLAKPKHKKCRPKYEQEDATNLNRADRNCCQVNIIMSMKTT